MKKIYLILIQFLIVVYGRCEENSDKWPEQQYAIIEDLTSRIEHFDVKDDKEVLKLYNERGIKHLFLGQFKPALNDFNHILTVLHSNGQERDCLFGAALWQRLLCHAYDDRIEEAYEDIQFIRDYFIRDIGTCSFCNRNSANLSNHYSVLQVAQFADPGERISSSQCKERVRGTANTMQILTLKIPNKALAAAVAYAISELEHFAYGCCDRSHWTQCLSPVIDAWLYMKNCMDKGLKIAPGIISPGR